MNSRELRPGRPSHCGGCELRFFELDRQRPGLLDASDYNK